MSLPHTPAPENGVNSDDFVPFTPPIDFQKTTKMIRSSFEDLPSFSRDAVMLISKIAADRVKEVVEAAYDAVNANAGLLSELGSTGDATYNSDGVLQVTAVMLKNAISANYGTLSHLTSISSDAKVETGKKKRAKKSLGSVETNGLGEGSSGRGGSSSSTVPAKVRRSEEQR